MSVITCPSGLRGEIREWVLGDEDILASAIDRGAGGASLDHLEQLISGSWMRTVRDGPYPGMTGLDASRVMATDLIYVLVQARMKTWGSEVLCEPACPGGNHTADGLADISQCGVTKILPEVAKALTENKPIYITLPRTGRKVGLRVYTRTVEKAMADIMVEYPKDRVTRSIMGRVAEVEGFDAETGVDAETKMPLFEWFKQLPGMDSMFIKGEILRIDPNYDTEALVRCSTCGETVLAEITNQPDFFAPTGRAQALSKSFSS